MKLVKLIGKVGLSVSPLVGLALLAMTSSPKDSTYPFDVKNFGAVCDGKTDDTGAIEKTYAAAAAAMATQGGAGVVYFPPSSGYCVASSLKIPSMDYSHGWLVSLFDNGLYANTIHPGNWNAFIGRTSNFAGLGGSFVWAPNAEWQQPKGASGPLVDVAGIEPLYFEGINMASQSSTDPAVKVHNSPRGEGTVFLTFKRCVIGSYSQYAMDVLGAFTLNISETSTGRIKLAMGATTIRDSFVHSIYMYNPGSSTEGNLEVENVLSENLNNEDFLTVDTTGGPVSDITIRRIGLADRIGKAYVLKHINHTSTNWVVNADIEMIPDGNFGDGMIDPTSAPDLISLHCVGQGCQYVLSQAKAALYDFMGYAPKGGLTIYGSQYLNPPFNVIQRTR